MDSKTSGNKEAFMELKICHLYPDILNLNGDNGNLLCLKRRLEARGIDAHISSLSCGETADLNDFDLFFIGGSQDFKIDALKADLDSGKRSAICHAVECGKTFLAVGGGYVAMCRCYTDKDNVEHSLIGAIDAYTVDKSQRLTGNSMFSVPEIGLVVGYEHHSGHTYLGSGCSTLGSVVSGYGNNGTDQTNGARYKNVFATYTNGPVLPKNPAFADYILRTALETKYGTVELNSLEDKYENAAHDYMVERLSAK